MPKIASSHLWKALTFIVLATGTAASDVAQCGAAPTSNKVPTELPGLLNFHVVHEYLFRGGEPDSKSLHDLKEKGVSTLIDLRGTGKVTKEESAEAKELGMKYINLPMDSHAPTKQQVDTFLKTVEEAKAGKSGPVYVHCQHGSDRTGCLVGVWRVTHDDWDYDKTYTEMRKYFFGPKYTELSGTVKQYAEEHTKKKSG
ncbi:MAG TPA: dual specificity protein phosphatase family protein [Chroococcales cyanobacterium]